MEEEVRRPGVSAEDVEQVLRLHADRVHDAVRRLGVDAGSAAHVVRRSALALVDAVRDRPQEVRDAVGWWFAEARRASRAVGRAAPAADRPLGRGVLAADGDQLVLAEALEGLPEDERLAVLLRDAYRLPWPAVAVALGTGESAAAALVFRARAHAVPLLDDEPAPVVPDHAGDLGGLARLGEPGSVAPRDATQRRHVLTCSGCSATVASQERVHLLLSGLAVDALPAEARTALLAETEEAARAALPAAAALVLTEEEREQWEDDDRRVLPPLLAALGVVLAVVLGTGLGIVMSRGAGAVLPASSDVLPAVSLPPVAAPRPITLPDDLPPPPPVTMPRTTVYYLPPHTTAPPLPTAAPVTAAPVTAAPATTAPETPTPTATPTPSAAPSLRVSPSSGPNGATLQVAGSGWQPGGRVVIDYLDGSGRATGSRATATVAPDGTFTAELVARDSTNQPGRHTVRATDGVSTATAAYVVTG